VRRLPRLFVIGYDRIYSVILDFFSSFFFVINRNADTAVYESHRGVGGKARYGAVCAPRDHGHHGKR